MLQSLTISNFTMAGRKGSTNLGLMVFMLMAMSRLFGTVDAEDHSSSLLRGNSFPNVGKMSFNEDWNSDAGTQTCTCNCYPARGAPPTAPTSQQSPVERKRSPPPAPYYQSPPSSPVYENPAPPAGSTTSPVTFASPPPPAPYGDGPGYGEPAPVEAAPQTFVPSPPPPPTY
ncbi:hypothetical protein M758_10G174800 [Ceratodon purpureus]|nr:hypothetical protein M758_10G174800 [Ceratodon purpureus]